MNKEISIKQSLDAATIAKSNFYIVSNKLKYYYILLVFASLVSIFFPIFIFNSNENNNLDYTVLPFLLAIIAIPFSIWYYFKKSAATIIQDKKRFFNNVLFKFSESSLFIEGEDFKNIYKWEELKEIKETNHWILIYINGYQSLIIDKIQQSDSDINDIKSIFNVIESKIKVNLNK